MWAWNTGKASIVVRLARVWDNDRFVSSTAGSLFANGDGAHSRWRAGAFTGSSAGSDFQITLMDRVLSHEFSGSPPAPNAASLSEGQQQLGESPLHTLRKAAGALATDVQRRLLNEALEELRLEELRAELARARMHGQVPTLVERD